MKLLLKKIASYLAKNNSLRERTATNVARLSWFLEFERKKNNGTEENAIIENAINAVIPDLVVKHGVFANMQYSEKISVGSTLFPKLLGSYEREIQPVIEQICKNDYDIIIDIGCAEGYYAVGFATRMQNVTVYAFDLDVRALRLCKELARLNGVESRVNVSAVCNSEIIAEIASLGKTLIFCDCEGCEIQIFDEKIIKKLEKCDLLIETHDCVDISISTTLRERFKDTHQLEIIESVDDIKKTHTYKYNELEQFNLQTRRILLGERPTFQEWFFFTSVD